MVERASKQNSAGSTTEVIIGTDEQGEPIKKTVENPPGERQFEYDMMISYCHADQDLIRKIYKFLSDQQFKIWIDLNHMHGPGQFCSLLVHFFIVVLSDERDG
jgi:hypothetical protein